MRLCLRGTISEKMNSCRAIIARGIMRMLPETRCFALKRALWRWAGTKVGQNVRICSSAFILGAGELEIGDDTWIGHQVFIETGSKVTIGAHVDIGPRVYIGTGSHKIDAAGPHTAGEGTSNPIVISDGVWLGETATVLPGVTIGKKSLIGAGSVVTHDIEAMVVAFGVPAKPHRTLGNGTVR